MTSIQKRATNGISGKFDILLIFGIIFYIIHLIINIVGTSIGFWEPNVVYYEATYLDDLLPNYLFPWVVLSHKPYTQLSLILGIFSVLFEIAAIIMIVFAIVKKSQETKNLFSKLMAIFLALNTILKYFFVYLSSFVLLEIYHYNYPDNIYWSFIGGNGFATFFSIFSISFLIQLVIIFTLIYQNYKQIYTAKVALSKGTINTIITPILILILGLSTTFTNKNVAAPLEIKPFYKSTLVFSIVTDLILIAIFTAYIVSIFLIKKKKQ